MELEKNSMPEQARTAHRQGQSSVKRLKNRLGKICYGEITRVIPGSYIMTANVKSEGRPEVQCLYAPAVLSPLIGVKDCTLPVEGTTVLMLTLPSDPNKYIALCCIPSELKGYKDLPPMDTVSMYGDSPEPGVNMWSADSWIKETGDEDKLVHIPSNSDRPFSLLPGEWAKGNTFGCMIGLFHFMASLKASERAKIECCVLDDLVRMTSGQFQHWHPFGETHAYNDGGYVNWEFFGSHFSPEARGYKDFKKAVTDKKTKDAMEERYAADDYDAVVKRRFHVLMGALGDMFQLYLRSGQDGLDPEKASDKILQSAMFKMQLDNSGAFNMASSAGIGFELNDRIPIPKRHMDAWDPEGDKIKDDTFKKKEHYDFKDESASGYPWMRNLKALDAEAYERSLSYRRFDELKKDFSVPEETDVETPKDEYDNLKSTTKHSRYDKRRGGLHIEEDGSVRIWDSFGGEIYMRGGDIVMSCPGHVLLQPGRGVVAMSNNIILKGKTGVDITAEDKAVRIAGTDVKIYSRTGMLLQSGGNLTLKAKDYLGFIGRTVITYADNILMKAEQYISAVAENMVAAVKSLLLESEGKAGLRLSGGGAVLSGTNIGINAGGGVNITKGSDILVPLKWADIKTNLYDLQSSALASSDSQLTASDEWLSPYTASGREEQKFTYRTSAEYGTEAGIETYTPSRQFQLYQTRWQLLQKLGCEFVPVSTDTWKEEAVNDTYPWPGRESRNGAYVSISAISNTDGSLLSKSRASLSKEFSSAVAVQGMDSYIIVK